MHNMYEFSISQGDLLNKMVITCSRSNVIYKQWILISQSESKTCLYCTLINELIGILILKDLWSLLSIKRFMEFIAKDKTLH